MDYFLKFNSFPTMDQDFCRKSQISGIVFIGDGNGFGRCVGGIVAADMFACSADERSTHSHALFGCLRRLHETQGYAPSDGTFAAAAATAIFVRQLQQGLTVEGRLGCDAVLSPRLDYGVILGVGVFEQREGARAQRFAFDVGAVCELHLCHEIYGQQIAFHVSDAFCHRGRLHTRDVMFEPVG